MKKSVLFVFLFLIGLCSFAQELPSIIWRQGDLGKLDWGMTRTEVEQALEVTLKIWNENDLVTSYTTSYNGTWINNVRISFNCRPSFIAQFEFYQNKLFSIWFCTTGNVKDVLTSTFGSGVSNDTYPLDENQRDWYDNDTYINADFKVGCVLIENWAINDKAYNRDLMRNGYNRYLRTVNIQ